MIKTKNVTIIGGGSSGWLTALSLVHYLPKETSITLIEDPNIGTIGVGESTLPQVTEFITETLGIPAAVWMRECDATFKLGTKFVGFGEYDFYTAFNPLYHTPIGIKEWFSKKLCYPQIPSKNFFDEGLQEIHLMTENKFIANIEAPQEKGGQWAAHIDAAKLGAYLKTQSISKGVHFISAKVEEVIYNKKDIESLSLSNGLKISSDLFIDCSGFKAVLSNKQRSIVPLKESLINDRAVVIRYSTEGSSDLIPNYTKATSMDSGWSWDIPLYKNRSVGYVYSSKFISDKEAEQELRDAYGLQKSTYKCSPPILYTPGRKTNAWVGNSVSIGLSYGFLEPLQATGLYFSIVGIIKLLTTLLQYSEVGFTPISRGVYNRSINNIFDQIHPLIEVHFLGNNRTDTPYWKYVTESSPSEALERSIDSIIRNGFNNESSGMFGGDLWPFVTTAQGTITAATWMGRGYRTPKDFQIAKSMPLKLLKFKEEIKELPSHRALLNNHIHNRSTQCH